MSHYSIIVNTYAQSEVEDGNSYIALKKLLSDIKIQGGPFNCFKGNAYEAAEKISKNKLVTSVTVIHISETLCGVWRNGVKS